MGYSIIPDWIAISPLSLKKWREKKKFYLLLSDDYDDDDDDTG